MEDQKEQLHTQEKPQPYTHQQMARFLARAQGLREGRKARVDGIRQNACPYPHGTQLKKGWRQGWRRKDKELKALAAQERYGTVLPSGSIFLAPQTVVIKKERPKQRYEEDDPASFRKELSRIYRPRA